jgi:hypothetical protein
LGDAVELAHRVRWQTVESEELLLEERSIRVRAGAYYTAVEWRSTFGHPDKYTHLGQTKESGIAVRVPPHWETIFGGRIRNLDGDVGEAGCFNTLSPWLNVEGRVVGDRYAGLILVPDPSSEACPWFTRDYGIHIYNPARHHPFTLAPGEQIKWALKVIAYDGSRTLDEVDALAQA